MLRGRRTGEQHVGLARVFRQQDYWIWPFFRPHVPLLRQGVGLGIQGERRHCSGTRDDCVYGGTVVDRFLRLRRITHWQLYVSFDSLISHAGLGASWEMVDCS